MTSDLEGQVQGDPAPEILEGRIWVDGCFDFFHHGMKPLFKSTSNIANLTGHAGAIVQARLLGDELYAGVHSDEAILANKGPTVMTLPERYASSHPTHPTSH